MAVVIEVTTFQCDEVVQHWRIRTPVFDFCHASVWEVVFPCGFKCRFPADE